MTASRFIVAMAVLTAAGGAFLWWGQQHSAPPVVRASVATAPVPAAPSPPSAAPAVRYPVTQPSAAAANAPPSIEDADADLKNGLIGLLGRKSVLSFLHLDGIVRLFVATVDNLGTDNPGSAMWPVNPAPGRLETERADAGEVIGARNADRYAAFVRCAEGIDTARAVALYRRLYPVLQRAYEELGYPGKYFNDRVVEVIDNLLATPVVPGRIKVKRLAIDASGGAGAGIYVFDDPALEARSSGQKILLRVGHENAAKLMAKLADVRRQIAGGGAARISGGT